MMSMSNGVGSSHFGDIENGVKIRLNSETKSQTTFFDVDIDRGCNGCNPSTLCNNQHIQLYRYSELPHFLRYNPYVVKGYRAFLPFSDCLSSLFVWNNETINVWSHFGGFLLFFGLFVYDNLVVVPELNGSLADHLIISIGLLCFQFCMLCSAGYHIFVCHSEKASKRWLAVDMAGICIGLVGCYLPGVHYAFYCLSIWRDIYLLTVFILSVAVLFLQLHPSFSSPEFWTFKVLLYCGLVGYGVLPTTHWIYLNGGFSEPIVQLFAPKVTVMYLISLAAFFFYLTKFPERCFPGKVDYIGSSHQCWHILIVGVFYYWHYAIGEILEFRIANSCHEKWTTSDQVINVGMS